MWVKRVRLRHTEEKSLWKLLAALWYLGNINFLVVEHSSLCYFVTYLIA